MIKIIESITEWQTLRQSDIWADKKIGLVPTMGNLHAGHRSLLTQSVHDNDITILSLFVNPTQFNDPKDLQHYPRTLQQDIALAEAVKVDYILLPDYQALYPDNYCYKVCETSLSKMLCGVNRAGHFDGVLTVVLKLLMLVKPHNAYFGEKDWQQLQLIREMVAAFFMDINIKACPTIRDTNGLALSSRNNLLTAEELQLAQHFPKLLRSSLTVTEITRQLTQLGFIVDYIEEHAGRRFGAVKLGKVRLIDNIPIVML